MATRASTSATRRQRWKVKRPSASRGAGRDTRKLLGGLVERDAARTFLFRLGLLGRHGLIDPIVGFLEVGGVLIGIFALDVRLLAVEQVHVSHGVVVVGTQLEGFVK